MPYKDQNKRREYQKRWIAQKRKKSKEVVKIHNQSGDYELELTIHHPEKLTPEQKASIADIFQTIESMSDSDFAAFLGDLRNLSRLQTKKSKNPFRAAVEFIPDLLALHLDLKLLHQRGGTA